MTAANIVSALSSTQAKAMTDIELTAKIDKAAAQKMLDALLARTFNASARHSIRLQSEAMGLKA